MSEFIAFDRLLSKAAEDPKALKVCEEFYKKVGDRYGIDEDCKLPLQAFKIKIVELPPEEDKMRIFEPKSPKAPPQ